MKFTTNLNLKKPDYTDPVDIGDINSNMDIVDSAIQSKIDNTRVLTDVPSGAKFTDTITTINGKTGAISKADIVALGIPTSDTNTTYTASTGLTLTETAFSVTNNAIGATQLNVTGNGTTAQYLRSDADGSFTWATPTNTTYTEITTAEIDAGTSTTLRTITGRRIKYILDKAPRGITVGITKPTDSSMWYQEI